MGQSKSNLKGATCFVSLDFDWLFSKKCYVSEYIRKSLSCSIINDMDDTFTRDINWDEII